MDLHTSWSWQSLRSGSLQPFLAGIRLTRADFSNYLTFLIACLCLYVLCLRFVPRRVALLTSAFFFTQPLLFGHAFINQKDTPFMAFFLATVVAGLAGSDRLARAAHTQQGVRVTSSALRAFLDLDRQSVGPRWRLAFGVWAGIFLVLLADLLVFGRLLAALEFTVVLAHSGQAWGPINRLYSVLAEDSGKVLVGVYLAKTELSYFVVGRLSLILLALAGGAMLMRRAFPRLARTFFPGRWQDYLLLALSGDVSGILDLDSPACRTCRDHGRWLLDIPTPVGRNGSGPCVRGRRRFADLHHLALALACAYRTDLGERPVHG